MFDEDEIACTVFGMLPTKKIGMIEKCIDNKIEEDARKVCEKEYGFTPKHNVSNKEFKRRFIRDAMRQITVDIFKCAKSAGKMIV